MQIGFRSFCAVTPILVFSLIPAAAPDQNGTRETPEASDASSAGMTLSLDDLVRDRWLVEEVYHDERIWPRENPGTKPPLRDLISEEEIRASVLDYLRKLRALESLWGQSIGATQIQSEIGRVTRESRRPATLKRLFEALGNDPGRIAETIIRPSLVERRIRSAYASDETIHREARRQAESEHSAGASLGEIVKVAPQVERVAFVRGDDDRPQSGSDPGELLVVGVDAVEWEETLAELESAVGGPPREGSRTSVVEDVNAFRITFVTAISDHRLEVVHAIWPKRSFDEWWAELRLGLDALFPIVVPDLTAPEVRGAENTCNTDSWRRLPDPAPSARWNHSAVWTGAEVIFWGGQSSSSTTSGSGSRYDPATDTWRAISTVGAPFARSGHFAVWTGTLMVVLGGSSSTTNTGGRYDPWTDSWTPTSVDGAPSSRYASKGVWAGSRLILWGGRVSNDFLGDGGIYDPVADSWSPMSVIGAPSPRAGHTIVWSEVEAIVWGGNTLTEYFSDGGRYDPLTDTWAPISSVNAPTARNSHSSIWTGSEMIVWGGYNNGTSLGTGARYAPLNDTWEPVSTSSAPSPRSSHCAVWTGSRMIVWGGSSSSTGGQYDPILDQWWPTSTVGAPSPRSSAPSVWSGTEMIVWGGQWAGSPLATGGRYEPVSDSWTTIGGLEVPTARNSHVLVWTGTEMVVWGGGWPPGRYDAVLDHWKPMSNTGGPPSRSNPVGVWTGTEVLVWGGSSSNTGGLYDPIADAWRLTPTQGAPSLPGAPTGVWTGSELVVWGGDVSVPRGARYNLAENSWIPTSLTGAPQARSGHTAAWTGTDMIVWGGSSAGTYPVTGGRYDPSTDIWTPTSTGMGTPAGRSIHTAVWTGTEMIVWGGLEGSNYLSSGARYRPDLDLWSPVSESGAPVGRFSHESVWTGTTMITWGGYGGYTRLQSGGVYDPVADSWTPTALERAPEARRDFAVTWSGSEMLVWGGSGTSANIDSGFGYCGVTTNDQDGDAVPDGSDNCRYASNPGQSDGDGDGAGDPCDNCPVLSNPTQSDGDGDRVGDACDSCFDLDRDGWGEPSHPENSCPLDNCPVAPNPDQADSDFDGPGDACDPCTDPDGDGYGNPGLPSTTCPIDNCPADANPDQADADGDTVGDTCDFCLNTIDPSQIDSDGDGIGDPCDNCPLTANPLQEDLDGDRQGDACDPGGLPFIDRLPNDEVNLSDGLPRVPSDDFGMRTFSFGDGQACMLTLEELAVRSHSSTDGGRTYTPGVAVFGGSLDTAVHGFGATQGMGETIHLAMVTSEPAGGWRIVATRSEDGCETWSSPIIVTVPGPSSPVSNLIGIDASGSTVAIGWLAYETGTVSVTASVDGGATWREPVAIHPPGSLGIFDASVAVSPASGTIHVALTAEVENAYGFRLLPWHSRSLDGGVTFESPKDLSPVVGPNTDSYLLDLQIAEDGGVLLSMPLNDHDLGKDAVVLLRSSNDGGSFVKTFRHDFATYGVFLVNYYRIFTAPESATVLLQEVGPDNVLYVHRLLSHGATWSSTSVLSGATARDGFSSPPAVTRSTAGTWSVTWEDNRAAAADRGNDVYVRSSTDDGVTWGLEVLVNSVPAGISARSRPSPTTSGTDDLVIAYLDTRDGGRSRNIYVNASNASTPAFGADWRVDDDGGDSPLHLKADVLSGTDGGRHVYVAAAGGFGLDLVVRVSGDWGATFGPAVSLSSGPSSHQLRGVAATTDGAAYVLYTVRPSTATELRLARSQDYGLTWQEGPSPLTTALSGIPVIVAGDGGLVLVAWSNGNDIFLGRSTDGGVTFTTTDVDDNTLTSDSSPVLAQRGGRVWLIWRGRNPSLTSSFTLLHRASANAGASFGSVVNLRQSTTASLSGGSPRPVLLPDDHGVAVWYETRSAGVYRVYRNRFDGVSWSGDAEIGGPDGESQLSPAPVETGIGGGWVVVAYGIRRGSDVSDLWWAVSTDGGESFPTHSRLDLVMPVPRASNTLQRLAADTSGRVWAVWGDYGMGPVGTIVVRRSDDGGLTFGQALRADTNTPLGAMPNIQTNVLTLGVSSSPGVGLVCWWGKRQTGVGEALCNRDILDGDADGVPTGPDCDDADGSVWNPPIEVGDVTVAKGPGTELSWSPQDPGARYDVAGASLASLRTGGGATSAVCLADDVPAPEWSDARPEPPPGEGVYYLVRAQSSCGTAPYGFDSAGLERIPIADCP